MTNILITGITGFIGAHLADYLSENTDNNIYGIFRSIKDESTFNALKLNEKKNINLILGNVNIISDIEDIIIQYDINKIYHLAAKVIVKDAAKEPVVTYITNMLGTLNILECLKNIQQTFGKEIPTLIQSSDKVYGESDILPYTENLPLNGLDVYSSSKVMVDVIARSYAYNYDLPVVVSRPCNIYGGCDFHQSRIIPSLANACIKETNENGRHKLILNVGSYHQKREYMYVVDLVKTLICLLDNIDITKGEAFNISSKDMFTTEEIVNRFLDIMNCKDITDIEFKEKDKTFKEIENQYLSCTKLYNKLPEVINIETDIHTSLTLTIESYKNWFDEMKIYYRNIEKIKSNLVNNLSNNI